MPRSIGVFCQQHWPVIPYPVDHRTIPSKLYDVGYNLIDNSNNFMHAIHEWGGLLAYYMSGKIGSILPTRCS